MSERQYNNTIPALDAETQLKDAGAVTTSAAGQVGGSDRVLDLGTDEFRTNGSGLDGQAPFIKGDIVILPSAIDSGDGDEVYGIVIQLADTEAFDNIVVNRAILNLGEQLIGGGSPAAQNDVKRYIMSVDNELGNRTFRYMRIWTHCAGTTPSINYEAWLSKSTIME